jgi:hypothetical protein
MNYATLEEAWGKPPVKISTEKRLHAAFDKHPLAHVPEERLMIAPNAKPGKCHENKESEKKHEGEQVKTFLRHAYAEHGEGGIMDLLPKGFLLATGLHKPSRTPSWDQEFCFEDVAKWILIAAVAVLLLDILRS